MEFEPVILFQDDCVHILRDTNGLDLLMEQMAKKQWVFKIWVCKAGYINHPNIQYWAINFEAITVEIVKEIYEYIKIKIEYK